MIKSDAYYYVRLESNGEISHKETRYCLSLFCMHFNLLVFSFEVKGNPAKDSYLLEDLELRVE